jgi:hypothetical protein
MPEEPELTSVSASPATSSGNEAEPAPAATAAGVQPSETHRHGPQRIPRWLERAELFLRVLLRLYIGLALCLAPWATRLEMFPLVGWLSVFWDQNPLFLRFHTVGEFAAHGAVRGIVSGLGLLNLWIAFRDAVRHRGTE